MPQRMTPEEQAARIAELEAQVAADDGELEIARRLIRDLQGKKDETALMAAIDDLMKQVAALKKIAEEERAYIYSLNVIESMGVDEHMRTEARRQLAEEHPEAFR